MKKGIVVILAILLTVGLGFLVPILMQPDKDSSDKATGGSTTPEATNSIVPNAVVTRNTEVVTPSATPSPKYESDIKLGTPSSTAMPQASSPKSVNSDKDDIEPTQENKENNESLSWVERKIQEHRDEIDDDDLGDFRRIYSSVNIAYIQSLMDEGLDDEGMTELKTYLRNTLGGDYERAKELFYEYSYLLSEV